MITNPGETDPDPGLPLRERKKLKARRAILEAAQRLFEAHGFEAAKMRDIAAAADLSYQTLYNYFPTKILILKEILAEKLPPLIRRIDDVVQSYEGGLLSALTEIDRIRFAVGASRDRALWRIGIADRVQELEDTQQVDPVYPLLEQTARRSTLTLLAQATQHGEIRPDVDLPLLADTLSSLSQLCFTSYLLDAHSDPRMALQRLNAQIQLVLNPYLQDSAPARPPAP